MSAIRILGQIGATVVLAMGVGAAVAGESAHWAGAWSASMLRSPAAANAVIAAQAAPALEQQTVRHMVRIGLGGDRARIMLDNRFGAGPVTINAASIGREAVGASLRKDSIRALHFRGRSAVTIAAGTTVYSDPVAWRTRANEVLGISLYVADVTEVGSWHPDPRNRQYVAPGDHTQSASLAMAGDVSGIDWLARVDVQTSADAGGIVALGDSITNGFRASAYAGWADVLQDRLVTARCARPVLNAGIDGNQVAASQGTFGLGDAMLRRFASDVVTVPGARYLIVLGGINDIGLPTMAAHAQGQPVPSADALATPVIAALRQIIARARARGLRVYGGTLLPYAGTVGTDTPQGEVARRRINAWIRGAAGYDAVIDFDAAVRDPKHPQRLRRRYNSGDNLHPSDAGYRAMAEAIPLVLFDCH